MFVLVLRDGGRVVAPGSVWGMVGESCGPPIGPIPGGIPNDLPTSCARAPKDPISIATHAR